MDGAMLDGGAMIAPCGADFAALTPWPRAPLRVGVLVDLTLTADTGGHVKCWQRIAEAAAKFPNELDLTMHFNEPTFAATDSGQPVAAVRILPGDAPEARAAAIGEFAAAPDRRRQL